MIINIYTDGACSGNPGPGGWAYIIKFNEREIIKSGGQKYTTNQQMELLAAIKALEDVLCLTFTEQISISLFSDSNYVIKGINEWIKNWAKNNWRGSNRQEVKNLELWKKMYALMNIVPITGIWIKGHSGHPENDRCDKLAVEESRKIILC